MLSIEKLMSSKMFLENFNVLMTKEEEEELKDEDIF